MRVCLCGCASVSSYKDTHGASNEMNVAYLFIYLFVYLHATFRELYFLIKIAAAANDACCVSLSSGSKVTDRQFVLMQTERENLESDWPLHHQSVTMTCLISTDLSWTQRFQLFFIRDRYYLSLTECIKGTGRDQLKAPSVRTHTQQVSSQLSYPHA